MLNYTWACLKTFNGSYCPGSGGFLFNCYTMMSQFQATSHTISLDKKCYLTKATETLQARKIQVQPILP